MINKIDKTLKERESRYGFFQHNAKITQGLCNVLKQSPNYYSLEEEHIEAFHMIFHKIARCVCGDPNYIDNIHDIIGYAKLLEEFLKNKKQINDKELEDEITMLTNAMQGKFGNSVNLSGLVSEKALQIFKERLKNGKI